MDQEIKDIINKNLPAQVGELLQQRLAQADNDAWEVEELKDKLKKTTTLLDGVNAENIRLRDQLAKHHALDKRTLEVEAKERNLELELAKSRASNAEAMASQTFRLVETIFKNSTVRETVTRNTSAYDPSRGSSHTTTDTAITDRQIVEQ